MSSRRFLIFSGHNDRAVVTLCRFFDQARLPFVIVAAGKDDAIHDTAWRDRVIFNRLDKIIEVNWLRQLATSAQPDSLVYCPTTEFINDFLLLHRAELQGCGLEIGLPAAKVYAELTSKAQNLRSELELEALLLTRSEEGMSLYTDHEVVHIPTIAREVYDVSGAGDTVIATLATMLGAGMSLADSVSLANRAGGIVVGKLGTATVTKEELFG